MWFRAVFEISTRRTGISAKDLERILGFGSYKTAWSWLHKLRAALVHPEREPLGPFVQVDERTSSQPKIDIKYKQELTRTRERLKSIDAEREKLENSCRGTGEAACQVGLEVNRHSEHVEHRLQRDGHVVCHLWLADLLVSEENAKTYEECRMVTLRTAFGPIEYALGQEGVGMVNRHDAMGMNNGKGGAQGYL